VENTTLANSSDVSDTSAPRSVVANPILNDHRFQTLVRNRRAFSWSLTALMLFVYFSFILTLAFSPGSLGRPIVDGQPATWGIPVGFGMFLLTFVLVAIYVIRANTTYDAAINKITQGMSK
jgi:uncharacterized membrane protein (DUF485 family)